MRNLTKADLRLWPNAKPELIDGILASQEQLFPKFGITKLIRLAHLMAQLSHESNGGTITEESLYYTTSKRMMEVWPSRFPTAASTLPYLGNPKKLANKVYNGRMGNRSGTDDGYDYRGRGLIQTTGKNGYQALKERTKVDVVSHPDLVNDPKHAFNFAVDEFFHYHGILGDCDRDDLVAVTKKINGGTNGLNDRRAWLGKWKRVLGIEV